MIEEIPTPPSAPAGRKQIHLDLWILIVLGILVVVTAAAIIHSETRLIRIEAQLEINSAERRAAIQDLGSRLEKVEHILPGAPEE